MSLEDLKENTECEDCGKSGDEYSNPYIEIDKKQPKKVILCEKCLDNRMKDVYRQNN